MKEFIKTGLILACLLGSVQAKAETSIAKFMSASQASASFRLRLQRQSRQQEVCGHPFNCQGVNRSGYGTNLRRE